MATAKKKTPSKRRVVSKKAVKKKVTKKRVARAMKKVPKKKTTLKKRAASKKVSKKKQVKKRKLRVTNADNSRSFKVRILDNCREVTVPVKTILDPKELKIRSKKTKPEHYYLSLFARSSGVTAVLIGAIFTLINFQAVTALDRASFGTQLASVSGSSATECGLELSIPQHVGTNIPPSCTLSVSSKEIKLGEEVVLSWESFHSELVWFNEYICEVDLIGSKTVRPTETTTYVAGVYGTQPGYAGISDCEVTVVVNEQDETPDARISISSSDGILQNTVGVHIIVPYANQVNVLAKYLETDDLFPLGSAQKLDETSWKFQWNTTEFLDGEYEVEVVIHNEFGDYNEKGGIVYTVQNDEEKPGEVVEAPSEPDGNTGDPIDPEPSETQAQGGEDESGANTNSAENNTTEPPLDEDVDTEPEPEQEQKITLALSTTDTLSKIETIKITASEKNEVKLYAKNIDNLNLYFIGFARNKDGDEWEFKWNTEGVVNGQYKVYVVGVSGVETNRSESVEVSVYNEVAERDSSEEDGVQEEKNNSKLFDPEIEITSLGSDPISRIRRLTAKTSQVEWLEFYAIPKYSQILKFLGLGTYADDGLWQLAWDTTQMPNGEYEIYARVKTEFGFSESDRQKVVVRNEFVSELTDEQEKQVDEFTKIGYDFTDADDKQESEQLESVERFVKNMNIDDENQKEIEELLSEYRVKLNLLLNELARAVRNDDTDTLEGVKKKMEKLKSEILLDLSSGVEKREIIDSINAYISKITFELEEETVQNEEIFKKRVGGMLYTDTDNDGITDYDEVNLYKTNPFVADSDGDGFFDGAEIESGYNPNDSSVEALIAYESPKEYGVVQEGFFTVNTITTLEEEREFERPKKALITGKGLPNSFVTIYIFSTPIIVTVRTDVDGNWQYVFDKELENGEHEIYVGVTDNAGKIVGKSEPLTFVKTAEAFTISDEGEEVAVTPAHLDESLMSGRTLLLIASLVVVSIGLVLVILGIYVSDRRKFEAIETV